MNSRTRNALAVATAVLCLAVSACTDTTTEPKSTITDANVFNDAASYRALLAKVYAGLAVTGQQGASGNGDIRGIDEGFSSYLRLFWELEELPTDEAVIAWGDLGLPELNTSVWAPSNPFVAGMYYRVYYQVMLANEFLRQSTDEKVNARGASDAVKADIKTYRAEARFLRALSYFHGVDMFGNIPLVTEDDPLGSTPPQQATRAEIYNFLVSELTAIKPDLPAGGASTYGRANRAAAAMLLAKVYMNAAVYAGSAHYTEALAQVQEVINSGFTLDASYRHLFQADNHTSPEIIFPVVADGQHAQTWGGMTFLVHAACGGGMNAGEYGIEGCWWGIRLKQQAYNAFEAGDKRASYFYTSGQNVIVADYKNFKDGVAAPKFTNKTSTGASGSNGSFPDTDFPMFRLADAYLMYAEAVLRNGGGSKAQAVQYVNLLRQRAFGDSDHNITEAQLTLDFLLMERLRELLWEGHRRTDLIRFGKFSGGSYLWAWKGGVAGGQSIDSHLDVYPLPANELVANPNLKQNAGYPGS